MEYLPFFLVLLASVIFSAAFRRFHLPWVLGLIVAGIVIGPYGFELAEVTPTLAFLSQTGLIFLMFMAGLETRLSSFKEFRSGIASLSLINGIVPFCVGYLLGMFFSLTSTGSILLGIIFMSSSIAVIIPTLEATGLLEKKIGKSIVSATILVDIASLVFLSLFLQIIAPVTVLPLYSFYPIVLIILVAFIYGLPKIRSFFPVHKDEKDLFESEVRIIIVMLIGVVVTFQFLGLHPIIAGFFVGLALSESIKSEILIEKLRTISYGIFIPVFFVLIGMETNVKIFASSASSILLVMTILIASMGSKFVSGWVGARIGGFSNQESVLIGVTTMPQLSTTLAVVFTAVEMELLKPELVTAMVILSIVSTVLTPLIMQGLTKTTSWWKPFIE
jgi:Kef-type K+ transport system membrane component KefB